MFQRLASIALGSGQLLRAEGEGLLSRGKRMLDGTWLLIAGSALTIIGASAVLVAGTAALARAIGWVGAVAIAGGLVLVLGVLLTAVARSVFRRAVAGDAMPAEIRRDAAAARQRIAGDDPDPAGTEGSNQRRDDGGPDDWREHVAGFVARHPGMVAGGALCAVTLVGPWRSLRYLSRGLLVASVVDKLRTPSDDAPPNGGRTQPGRPADSPRAASERSRGLAQLPRKSNHP